MLLLHLRDFWVWKLARHAGYAPTQPVRQTGRPRLDQWGLVLLDLKMVAGIGNAPISRRLQRRANLSQLSSLLAKSDSLLKLVLPAGFAPATSRLSTGRSTFELR